MSLATPRWFGLVATLLLSLSFAIAMATLLNYYKFRHTLNALVRDNVAVAAQNIDAGIRLSLSMGLNLAAMQALPALLERQSLIDPTIRLIRITDMQGRGIHAAPAQPAASALPETWLQAARPAKKGFWQVEEGDSRVVGWTLRNSFDLPIGLLAIQYSTADSAALTRTMLVQLIHLGAITFALAGVAGALLLGLALHLGKTDARRRWLGTTTIMLLTLVALATPAWLAVPLFESKLLPQLERNARIIGQVEAALLARATSYGIPLAELYGVEQTLEQALGKNPALASIAVLDRRQTTVFRAINENAIERAVGAPLLVPIAAVGAVEVALDPGFARKMIRELALDSAVVLVVALFLTLELLAYLPVSNGAATDPLRACRDIRTPAFIFFLSEELTRPFLPGFAAEVGQGFTLLPTQLVSGLPIMLFMLIVALSQPWLGALGQRLGYRRLLLAGASATTLGFIACAQSTTISGFLLARALCAIGYAAIFVAAQGHILINTQESNRAQGFALFVACIMVATICGPSIGGILADTIGARSTFLVAAGLAALALPFIRRLPRANRAAEPPPRPTRPLRGGDLWRLLHNRRFLALCLAAAVPAKILLTGCCFFLLPLYILSLHGSQSMTGRLLMVYAVLMVLLMPLAARHADRYRRRGEFIVAGLCISALGGLAAISGFGVWTGLILVATLGIGQALSITAQSTLVASVTPEEIAVMGADAVYGVYRLLERLGSALGPMLAGGLLAWLGFKDSFIVLGGLALSAALAFHLLVVRSVGGKTGAAP